VGNTRLAFLKYLPGEHMLSAGEPCTHIKFVISGHVRLTICNESDRVKVSQTLSSPAVISPDFLFGRNTLYPASATAIDTVSIMQIEKKDFIPLLQSDDVFLFNYLNLLSMNAQLSIKGVLALTSGSLEKRICYWILALTQNNGKNITLECRHKDMYTVFGVQRQSLISALDNLKTLGMIDYTSTEIRVTDRRLLMKTLAGKDR